MTSGPVYVAVLERENGVAHWRSMMGATDPAKADAGTIRKESARSIERNAAHGSANAADAAREVTFFFSGRRPPLSEPPCNRASHFCPGWQPLAAALLSRIRKGADTPLETAPQGSPQVMLMQRLLFLRYSLHPP